MSETCENCGRTIGKLERPQIWDGHVVCAECRIRLEAAAAAEQSAPRPTLPYASQYAGPARAAGATLAAPPPLPQAAPRSVEEVLIHKTGPHFLPVFAAPILITVVLTVAFRPLLVVGLVVLVICLVRWLSTEYRITSRRITAKRGVLGSRSDEILLAKVESVSVRRGLLETLVGCGSIEVRGTGGLAITISGIAGPEAFREKVVAAVDARVA